MAYIITILILSLLGCGPGEKPELPLKGNFPNLSLIDSNKNEFNFNQLKGEVVIVSYIYTNCPDICHITSKKMDALKKSFEQSFSTQISFVSISFDPSRDTPDVLDKHIEHMGLDMTKWFFVTGRRDKIYETLKTVGIEPVLDKMDNKKSYTYNHRDRISLLDKNGNIRKHYKGSTFDSEELLNDIKALL